MNRDPRETLSTADLANAAETRNARAEARETPADARRAERAAHPDSREPVERQRAEHAVRSDGEEKLAPLFPQNVANEFRSRWDQVQFSFVDDPRRAVREGDELVAQVMKNLAQTFSEERSKLEQELGQTDASSTENLRMALRRYRSFFQRLLSL